MYEILQNTLLPAAIIVCSFNIYALIYAIYTLAQRGGKKESQHICVTCGSTFHFLHSFGIKYCCGHEYQLWNCLTMTKEGLVPLKFKNYKHFENYYFPLLNFTEDFTDAVVGGVW